MDAQHEIQWDMRTTLIDWLLQVHMRYHMLPETLWIAVNIIDRFLSKRVVSLVKFQLVGVTAMFVAAKYEEIMAPSVEEFVYMTENGYTRDDILKGEKILLAVSLHCYCHLHSELPLPFFTFHLPDPRLQNLSLLFALLMASSHFQSRRLRYSNAHAFEIPHGAHLVRPPLLKSQV